MIIKSKLIKNNELIQIYGFNSVVFVNEFTPIELISDQISQFPNSLNYKIQQILGLVYSKSLKRNIIE